jgi:hypothetical protein
VPLEVEEEVLSGEVLFEQKRLEPTIRSWIDSGDSNIM